MKSVVVTLVVAISMALVAFATNYFLGEGKTLVIMDTPRFIEDAPEVCNMEGAEIPASSLFLTPTQGYPIPVTAWLWRTACPTGEEGELLNPQTLLVLSSTCWAALMFWLVLFVAGFGECDEPQRRVHALVASGILLLHPITVEAGLWEMSVKDLSSTMFLLIGMWAYFHDTRSEKANPSWFGGAWWWTMIGAFVSAMLSKPTAMGFVVFPVIADFVFRDDRLRVRSRSILATTALVFFAILVVMYTREMSSNIAYNAVREYDSVVQQLLVVPYVFHQQLQHVLVPLGLLPVYDIELPSKVTVSVVALLLLMLVCMASAILGVFKARSPIIRLGCVVALLGYSTVSGVFGLKMLVADRYMLVPLVGLSMVAVGLLQPFLTWARSTRGRVIGTLVTCALIGPVVLSEVWTIRLHQAELWESPTVMWARISEAYPNNGEFCAQSSLAFLHEYEKGMTPRGVSWDLTVRHAETQFAMCQQGVFDPTEQEYIADWSDQLQQMRRN